MPTAKADIATTPNSSVVIAQMYPGASGTATQEFVELYNNFTSPIEVTNWCVNYISSTGNTTKKLACLDSPDVSTGLWLGAGGYAVFVSNDLRDAMSVTADAYFSGGISADHGHIVLVDASNNEIDRLGWGDAINPETTAVASPANGKALQRKTASFHLQDTDDNSVDFIESDPLLHASGVYEDTLATDVCPNIVDAQTTMPDGYLADENGDCQPDSCLNLDGLQISVPEGYDSDGAGVCTQHDECENVDGVQTDIPTGMVRDGANDCSWNVLPITLTELYPNATGSDTGNEFIEVYNPTDTMVDLSLYTIRVGINLDKTFTFPIGATIAPGEYKSFDNNTIKFSLVNSTSRVQLVGLDNVVYGDSTNYENPNEGESWALIKGTWQYTNRPTPSDENLASITVETNDNSSSGTSPTLKPCAPNQYRNPDTNRCKKISTTSLAPCNDGQVRNPETNRCRNVVTTASVRKPCSDNQYRSEDTNRCRNLPAATVPDANFAVQPIKDTGTAFVGWWALGGVGLLAAGYGAWEWRRELAMLWQKGLYRFHK
ncbi:MAG: lamin tail domain-containing protein [Candidatus Nomurabacteria bacterium]|nr:MAG: lamin tail domain-containing protein [Candidatus Nomurabacteria bacterium]